MTSAPESEPETPWIGIAVALAGLGLIIVAVLAAVQPPPKTTPAQIVQHTPADVGAWDPFADAGADDIGTTDTRAQPDSGDW